MAALIFYIRCVFLTAWFFAATFVSLFLIPFRWKDPNLGAIFGRIVSWGGTRILGYHVRVENMSRLYTSQPCIYVANHQSNLDIITMGCVYPWRTVVIGKKELKWVPLFGLFFVGSGMIMIDRGSRVRSVAGLEQAKEAMLKRGLSIWIFPEGTRNRGNVALLPFKKGAFHMAVSAQVPIVPMVHQYLKAYWDPERRVARARDEIVIRVLEPIETKGMTVEDVPRLMEMVRGRMLEGLRVSEMQMPVSLIEQASQRPQS